MRDVYFVYIFNPVANAIVKYCNYRVRGNLIFHVNQVEVTCIAYSRMDNRSDADTLRNKERQTNRKQNHSNKFGVRIIETPHFIAMVLLSICLSFYVAQSV